MIELSTITFSICILFIERTIFAINEYNRIQSTYITDIISMESCNRLNYRDIAKDHVELCDSINQRLQINILTRVITNTVNDIVYRPITVHTVFEIALFSIIVIMLTMLHNFIKKTTTIDQQQLPTMNRRIKND